MRFASSATLAVLVFAFTLQAAPARAQDDRGRMHFQAGASYFEAGEYDNALREFLRAYDLSQRAALFYNIASCYQQLGDLARAADYLDRYLREVEDIPNRGNLELRLQHLRERAAGSTSPPTPDTTTDEPAGEGSDAPAPGGGDGSPPEEETQEEPAADADAGGGPTGMQVGGYVGIGVGGAGAVLAVAFGMMALKERDSVADSACGMTRSCTGGDVARMDKLALIADLGLGLAVAGVATGIVLLIVGADDDESDEDAGVSARLTPWVAPSGAGATLTGRF